MSLPASALPAQLAGFRPLRGRWTTIGALALVAGTGFTGGGYFPDSWGWATLGAGWAAAAVLLARRETTLARPALAAAGLLTALTAWTAVSFAWSVDTTQTALEAQRTSVYAAAMLAALLCGRERPERLLHGAWLAVAALCVWALATRLVPDRWGTVDAVSGYRLAEPIGYWNSLGLLAAIGSLLALGIAARAETRLGRAAAAATLPLLVAALYFTFSRGAWLALAAGFVASILLARARLQLVAAIVLLAPWPALAVLRASHSDALTTPGSTFAEMTREGHRLVLVLLALSAVSAAAGLVLRSIEPRLELSPRWLIAARAAIAVVVVTAVAVGVARFGSPVSLARDGWHSFTRVPPTTGPNLNERLFSLSGNGRTTQWRVAWEQARAYPWLGSGAGTYEVYWNRHRSVPFRVRDAHNLYLETLAELGPVGLALLAGALVLPLGAALRRRSEPLAFAASGAYVAFLLHAAVDWDWEITAVTLSAILCGAALLAAPGKPLGRGLRTTAATVAVLLAATGVYTIATRLPMERLDSDLSHARWASAERNARRASALAPWSSEPWLRLGEGALNGGQLPQAHYAFERAAAKDPGNWVVWYDLARASAGPGRAQALARAKALSPLEPALAEVAG